MYTSQIGIEGRVEIAHEGFGSKLRWVFVLTLASYVPLLSSSPLFLITHPVFRRPLLSIHSTCSSSHLNHMFFELIAGYGLSRVDRIVAAISFTLFPSVPNRACDNPASSVSPPNPDEVFNSENSICILSFGVISMSWLGAWIVFGRLLGLVFPLPDLGPLSGSGSGSGNKWGGGGGARSRGTGTEEGRSLLSDPPVRPQVGWGRMVAGEAFELGEEDDD